MVNTLDLDLRPGSGLGPFELGSSLFDILAFLRRPSPPIFPSVSVKFDTAQPTTSPVILHLRPHLDLLFTRNTQRLHTISLSLRRNVESHPPLVLSYKNEVLAGPDVVLRRTAVQRTMGPTYKGERMRYPGVWFSFDEDVPGASAAGNGMVNGEGNLEVKRVVITQRQEENEAEGQKEDNTDEITVNSVMYGDIKKATIRVHDGVYLDFYSPEQTAEPVHVRIGTTTAEDLTCDLGPPILTHYKEDDRMAIYATANDDEESYFYNYFQHGLDFLISGKTHRVRKIILHTNVPGSPLFQRYKRCPWEFVLGARNEATVDDKPDGEGNHESASARASFEVPPGSPGSGPTEEIIAFYDSMDVLKSHLSPGSQHSPQPSMQLERAADLPHNELLTLPNATTQLSAFDGVVCEATEAGDMLCVILF